MSIEFYQKNSVAFFKDTVDVDMSNIYLHFTKHLHPHALVLDAGCGSGRDTKAFLDLGYQVEAFDASSEMVALASSYTGINVKHATFNEVDDVEIYDAIWCCASLLHIPEKELPQVMNKLINALKVGGSCYVSFKYGTEQRKKGNRLFTDLNQKRLDQLISKLVSIEVESTWVTVDNRNDREEKWLNAILRKRQVRQA